MSGPRKKPRYSLAEMQALQAEAGRESLERIEADLRRASWKTQDLLMVIQANLFEPDLEVDSSRAMDFHRETGTSPRDYVNQERVATGARLLARSNLGLGDIAFLVGFSERRVFSNAFERHTGLRPSAFRRQWKALVNRVGRPEIELHSLRLLRELRTGDLDADQARQLLDFFERLEKKAEKPVETPLDDRAARRLAEEEWSRVADWHPDRRFVWVRDILRFNRPAFFFLLGEKIQSKIASGAHREALSNALGWTQLAMVHVEANAEELGEEATRPLRRQVLDWLLEVRQKARALPWPVLEDRFWLEGQSVLWLALLEARVHLGLGETDAADRLFRRVRTNALRRRWSMESALAALGLASVIAAEVEPGCPIDSPEVADLVSQVLPVVQTLDDQGETRALRRDLGDALRHDSLTRELLESTRVRLERLAPPARLQFRHVKVKRDKS